MQTHSSRAKTVHSLGGRAIATTGVCGSGHLKRLRNGAPPAEMTSKPPSPGRQTGKEAVPTRRQLPWNLTTFAGRPAPRGTKFSHWGHRGHWGTKRERRGFFTPLGLAPYLLSVLELPGCLQWLLVTRGLGPIFAVQPAPRSLTHCISTSSSPGFPGVPGPCSWPSPSSASCPVSVSPPTCSLVQQQLSPICEVIHTWGWSAQGSQPAGTWMLKCRGGGQILR